MSKGWDKDEKAILGANYENVGNGNEKRKTKASKKRTKAEKKLVGGKKVKDEYLDMGSGFL